MGNEIRRVNTSIITPQDMRFIMRRWTTGVTIVSSRLKDDQHGMTVSSFTSISLDPPLILVSLALDTRTYRLVDESRVFGVTILSDSQQEISNRFAGRIDDSQDRFTGLEIFGLETGAPFIKGSLAYLDCRVISKLEAGNNSIILGQVVATQTGENGSPLLYYDRDYHNLCDE